MKFNSGKENDPFRGIHIFDESAFEKDADCLITVIESGKTVVVSAEPFDLFEACDIMEESAERGKFGIFGRKRGTFRDHCGITDHIRSVIVFALHRFGKRAVFRAERIRIGIEGGPAFLKTHFAYSTDRVSRMIETLICPG